MQWNFFIKDRLEASVQCMELSIPLTVSSDRCLVVHVRSPWDKIKTIVYI